MASSKYDLQQNVDAVTHFLDVLNSPREAVESESSASESVALSQSASAAAIGVLRLLQERETMPLADVVTASDAPLLDVTEAISRLSKSGVLETRQDPDGKEALSLTEHGQHLAEAVTQGAFGT